jgi:hypothetical protein
MGILLPRYKKNEVETDHLPVSLRDQNSSSNMKEQEVRCRDSSFLNQHLEFYGNFNIATLKGGNNFHISTDNGGNNFHISTHNGGNV